MAGVVAAETGRVPGMAESRSVSCSYNCAADSSVYLLSFGDSEKVSRWSVLSPTSTVERFTSVRANRPAHTSRRSEMATCPVTSDLRSRLAEPVALDWPDWLFSVGTRSGRVLWRAGNSPKASPVKSDKPRQKARMRGSRLGVRKDCTPLDAGSEAMMPRRVQ